MARHFSNWLKAYMQYTRDSESPDAFHFWTGVSTLAGALRRRVWIDMRKFQWTPNFYIILVGPPGIAAKSTSTRTGSRLLTQVNSILDPKDSHIKFGPQSITWQALTMALEKSMEYTKYFNGSGQEEVIPNSSLTISVPELGTFFKTDDTAMMDVLVSLWDGQLETWGHETKTVGSTEIKNPWLNIIGCTTPSWLQNSFPEHMIGGGLTSRIIFVFGDTKRHLVAYPDEVINGPEYYKTEKELIEDLRDISRLSGPYVLSSAARQWGRDYYQRLWTVRPNHMASDRYSGYIARKQTHVHKLAIILAAAQRDQLIIEEDDLRAADQLLASVEPHMIKVFESVGLVNEARQTAEVVHFVRHHKFLTMDELWNFCRNGMQQRDFLDAVKAAVQARLLVRTVKEGKLGLEIPPKPTIN